MINPLTPKQYRFIGFKTVSGYRRTCRENPEIKDIINSVLGTLEKDEIPHSKLEKINSIFSKKPKFQSIIDAVEDAEKAIRDKHEKHKKDKASKILETPPASDPVEFVEESLAQNDTNFRSPTKKRKYSIESTSQQQQQQLTDLRSRINELEKRVNAHRTILACVHSSAHDIASNIPLDEPEFIN